ncbi:MAG: hypothetical protein U9Q77_11370 [Candidatus Marinimicrobia bacterium]|nr:hypothetical protein [Candidatus Neomarinimicrobiota bacterium]
MNHLNYSIELLSDTVPASGLTASAIVDTEIAVDSFGLPVIPGKRLKGLMRESLLEVGEITGHDLQLPLDSLFGQVGVADGYSIMLSDASLSDSEGIRLWLSWANEKFPGFFRDSMVLESFTDIRRQTKLKDGVAVKHSLRSMRVLKTGLTFFGSITSDREIPGAEVSLLAMTLGNLRFLGLNRNRGLGRIKCELLDSTGTKISQTTAYKKFMEGV